MGTYSTCTVHTINVLSKKGRGGHIRGGGDLNVEEDFQSTVPTCILNAHLP